MFKNSKPLSREQTRLIDKITIEEYGLPGVVLMENAGREIARFLLSLKPKGKIVICCGKGNNGGDGYVIARYLANEGFPIEIIVFANNEDVIGDAKTHLNIILKMGLPVTFIEPKDFDSSKFLEMLNTSEWLIDGLFGTGLQGTLKQPYIDIINTINQLSVKVLAIDIPSGLNCDTGEPLGTAIRADYTCPIISLKKGFLEESAKKYLGMIETIDIGIPNTIFLNLP